jgi:hypothetical protein
MADITNSVDHKNMEIILWSLLTDITNTRAALNAVVTKLNADAWVTDTDYAAATALTTTL